MTLLTLDCACGRMLDPAEGGKCAFCRMAARGDNRLICHDDTLGDDCECCGDVAVAEAA